MSMAFGATLSPDFMGNILDFDTFEGHVVRPLEDEVDLHGRYQSEVFDNIVGVGEKWAACSLAQVMKNFECVEKSLRVRLPVKLVKGDACITARSISAFGSEVSMLHLDMDWYAPTIAAFESIGPFLSKKAIIILDDYGHHSGVKQAYDEYFKKIGRPFDYVMTDYSSRRIRLLN